MTNQPNRLRLVAIDLDGTLLRQDKTVSERTRETLRQVQGAGIGVVIVTGRPPRRARAIAREVGVSGLAVCCNGGIVYDLATDQVVLDEMMPSEVAQRLVTDIRAAVPGIHFATERGLRFGHEPAYTAFGAYADGEEPLCDDAHILCAEGVTKLIVRHPTIPAEELWAITREIAGDAATATYSGAPFVEISATGITKASALAHLCARLGIAQAETIAIGDMPNDLPMLAWAGHSVAVANGHPEVRAAAHAVTASNEEDGVALVLERLLAM
jgi:Cof subfamily protein (haloacid dehalogenase superfamily)